MIKSVTLNNGKLMLGAGSQADSALLQLESTEQGFLVPRMTEAQRDAIPSPANGLVIFNTDADELQWYQSAGPSWEAIASTNPNTILQGGNTFAAPMTIGTNDAQVLNLETDSETRIIIAADSSTIMAPDTGAATGTLLSLRAGSPVMGNNDGGDIELHAGAASGSGIGGNVRSYAGIDGEIGFFVNAVEMMVVEDDHVRINDEFPLRLMDGGSNYVEIKAPTAVTASYAFTLPADAPSANDYLGFDGTNYVWDPLDTGETWTKYQLTHTAFQTAGTQNNIQLFSAPAGTLITAIVMKHTTQFAIGGSAYFLSIGITGDLTRYQDEMTVSVAVADQTFVSTSIIDMTSFGGATSVRINARSSTNLLNTSTAGAVDVWVRSVLLP